MYTSSVVRGVMRVCGGGSCAVAAVVAWLPRHAGSAVVAPLWCARRAFAVGAATPPCLRGSAHDTRHTVGVDTAAVAAGEHHCRRRHRRRRGGASRHGGGNNNNSHDALRRDANADDVRRVTMAMRDRDKDNDSDGDDDAAQHDEDSQHDVDDGDVPAGMHTAAAVRCHDNNSNDKSKSVDAAASAATTTTTTATAADGASATAAFVVYDDEKERSDAIRPPLLTMCAERGLELTRRNFYQLVDYNALEQAGKIEDVKVSQYALHTMHRIDDTIVRSLRALQHFFIFAANSRHTVIARHIEELDSGFRSMMPGMALYVRVVFTTDSHNSSNNGNNNDSSSNSDSRRLHAEVMAGVRRVLADFALHHIEPVAGELACDVTHYAHFMPHLRASRRNVAQVVQDMRDFVRDGAIAATGHPGTLTSKKELRPMTADAVVAEVAARIRDEVMLPLRQHAPQPTQAQQQHEANGAMLTTTTTTTTIVTTTRENGSATRSRPHCHDKARDDVDDAARCARVCIGVAPTPVLAKMACDAEVALLLRRGRDNGNNNSSNNNNSSDADASTLLVRVRSLHRHTATARDRRQFMSHFKIAQVPCVTPAFARALRDAFGIVTCAQLREKRHLLGFVLSRDTFAFVYAIAHGCMRFADEARVPLLNTYTLVIHDPLRQAMATNLIAIANDTRSGLRGNPLPMLRRHVVPYMSDSIATRHVYGRLASDDAFVALCRSLGRTTADRLRRYSMLTGGVGVTLTGGDLDGHNAAVMMTPTQDVDAILTRVEALARQVAVYRQRGGFAKRDALYYVSVSLYRLTIKSLVPTRWQAEMAALKDAYFDARGIFERSAHYTAFSQNRSIDEVRREFAQRPLPRCRRRRRDEAVGTILSL